MSKSNSGLKGELNVLLTDENGEVKLQKTVPNIVVTTGREYIAQRLIESGRPAEVSHMAIGDSDATALVSDTTLANELARVSLSSATATVNTVGFSATWGPGVGTGTISEAGIFNDSADGTMICRTTFNDVIKLAGDTLAIDWTVTIGTPLVSPEPEPFIFTIETTTVDEVFEIGANNVGTFDAVVDWGDTTTSTVTAYNDPNLAHTYATPGTYTVSISGTFPNVEFENSYLDAFKVRTVVQLGDVGWLALNSAFKNCRNVTSFASGNCDTSAVTTMGAMFHTWQNCTSFDVSTMDTSSVTDMSYMFSQWTGSSSVSTVDFSNFDTSNVTNMEHMFDGNNGIDNIDVSSFDTSSVTNMSEMFENADVTSINVSGLDTSSVTTMFEMFRNSDATTVTTTGFGSLGTGLNCTCRGMFQFSAATSLDLASFDTSNVTNMQIMFSSCNSLTTIGGVSGWDTSSVTTMSGMFSSCSSLTSLDLSSWNTSSVTNMGNMFSNCSSLTSLDLSSWNTSSVTAMSGMFSECSSLNTYAGISSWDVSSVTTMFNMFRGNDAMTSLDLSAWDVSSVTTMRSMFYGTNGSLKTINVTGWNISNVTNMSEMFRFAKISIDLSTWNTSNVTDMSYMFDANESISTVSGLSGLNTSSVTNMRGMFRDILETAPGTTNLDLSSWNTSSVTSMIEMFDTTRLASINVSGWNTSSVTSMSNMFYNTYTTTVTMTGFGSLGTGIGCDCTRMFYRADITSLDLSSFDVTNVDDMERMFSDSSLTTIGNVSGWNTSNVISMFNMFYNMTSLTDVAIDSFNVESVTSFGSFMLNTTIPVARYDATLIAWDAQTVQPNESINFGTNQYTGGGAAEAARTSLITNDGWTITDGGSV